MRCVPTSGVCTRASVAMRASPIAVRTSAVTRRAMTTMTAWHATASIGTSTGIVTPCDGHRDYGQKGDDDHDNMARNNEHRDFDRDRDSMRDGHRDLRTTEGPGHGDLANDRRDLDHDRTDVRSDHRDVTKDRNDLRSDQ